MSGNADSPVVSGKMEGSEKLLSSSKDAECLPDGPKLHVQCGEGARGWSVASAVAAGALSPTGKRLLRGSLHLLHLLLAPALIASRLVWRRRPLPPLLDPLLRRPAAHLAELIRTRQVTSEAVVSAFVARAREVNPFLNAVVQDRFEDALEEARMVDRCIAELSSEAHPEAALAALARDRPLLGVPLTVKESVAVQGLSHASGQLSAAGARAAADAEAVRRLRAAGAIPLLVSNCPELCMHYESRNRVTGVTCNPFDTRRTPAGSSGGEAALLGAAASVISVGSDIGGSSRLPAMFTGVFGHKPTAGVVSDEGHLPVSDDEDWWRFFTVAPMARYAEDLLLMLKIMAKDEALPALKLDEPVDVSKIRIVYMENDGGSLTSDEVHPDIVQGMRRALCHLEKICDVKPTKIQIQELKRAIDLTGICLFRLRGINSVFQVEDNPHKWRSVGLEWLKFFLCISKSTFTALLYGPLKWLFQDMPDHVVVKYLQIIDKLKREFKGTLRDDGVFLYPTFTDPAVFHNEMYFKFLNGMYCSIFNILELPATNCPVGKTDDGLPIGIQIVAAPYNDRLSIAVAQELERGLGGWSPPPFEK